jgi:hypothetical protein
MSDSSTSDPSGGDSKPPRRRPAYSLAAEAAFRTRLVELGATLLEPKWLGAHERHRARCAAGHDCSPTPHQVQRGQGICLICAKRDPATAAVAFRTRLAELDATLLEPRWLGSLRPHRVRCAAGHLCRPRPADVQQGHGICRACVGNDPATAEARFRARLVDLCAKLLESEWLGAMVPHRVRCVAGHLCNPTPANVQRQGICRTCAGRDPALGEVAFRARMAALGATVLGTYMNNRTAVQVLCANGHPCWPVPHSGQRGEGICRTCALAAYQRLESSYAAEKRFRTRLVELGAELLEPKYLGVNKPHRIRCAAGHEPRTYPGNVRSGNGICRYCTGKTWDVFYVVTSGTQVKFGITSGDPRPRLAKHRLAGYSTVIRLLTDLPDEMASDMENAVLATLSLARLKPVLGREYYGGEALGLIVDITDNYPR